MRRGDVYHVDLDPIQGREQAGKRYVLILSPESFNRYGTPLICPITMGGNSARMAGYAVSLTGLGTISQGVVLCNQPRTMDLFARNARFVERLPMAVVEEVLAKVQTLLD